MSCLRCLRITLPSIRRYSTGKFNKSEYEAVVGLEVHAQIQSNSKLFTSAGVEFNSDVNSNVELFDASIPGTLPVLNRRCVEAGVLTALALDCQINPVSYFDRKHYFYADLPAGYQITQQRAPLATCGEIEFPVEIGNRKEFTAKRSRLKQLQLEQDSGKTLHYDDKSLIDLNRAGIALMELVFEPDLSSGEDAAALIKELILILTKLNTCSCKMEEGALRVDANVSVKKRNESTLGVRTEIKNIGSVRAVANAVEYEIEHQLDLIRAGSLVVNETKQWDAEAKLTVSMRDKEVLQDYRFMPEPNLPPLFLQMDAFDLTGMCGDFVSVPDVRDKLPVLPKMLRKNLIDEYGVKFVIAARIVDQQILHDYFHEIVRANRRRDIKTVVNVLLIEFLSAMNRFNLDAAHAREILPAQHLGELCDLLHAKDITLQIAAKTLEILVKNAPDKSPRQIVVDNDWLQINDDVQLRRICEMCMTDNWKLVEDYRAGRKKVFKAFLGKIWKTSGERANMGKVTRILRELLET